MIHAMSLNYLQIQKIQNKHNRGNKYCLKYRSNQASWDESHNEKDWDNKYGRNNCLITAFIWSRQLFLLGNKEYYGNKTPVEGFQIA